MIVTERASAPARLHKLVVALSKAKRRMAADDPELFATFHRIVTESREVVDEHLATLAGFLAAVIADGVAHGDFSATDPAVAGRAVLHATARFHHPAHAPEWTDARLDADLDAVLALLLRGLAAR